MFSLILLNYLPYSVLLEYQIDFYFPVKIEQGLLLLLPLLIQLLYQPWEYLLRIVVLILVLYYAGQNWFDLIHLVFWRFVAGFYVALVWIFLVNKFKVKSIPVYSDVKELLESIKRKKKN